MTKDPNCTCPGDGLSDFDRGMVQSFADGVVRTMGDTITINGTSIPCAVPDRSNGQRNIQGGKSILIIGTVECTKADFLRAGGTLTGGDTVTFSDGETGKVSTIDDPVSPLLTLRIGPVLQGSGGPNNGQW